MCLQMGPNQAAAFNQHQYSNGHRYNTRMGQPGAAASGSGAVMPPGMGGPGGYPPGMGGPGAQMPGGGAMKPSQMYRRPHQYANHPYMMQRPVRSILLLLKYLFAFKCWLNAH